MFQSHISPSFCCFLILFNLKFVPERERLRHGMTANRNQSGRSIVITANRLLTSSYLTPFDALYFVFALLFSQHLFSGHWGMKAARNCLQTELDRANGHWPRTRSELCGKLRKCCSTTSTNYYYRLSGPAGNFNCPGHIAPPSAVHNWSLRTRDSSGWRTNLLSDGSDWLTDGMTRWRTATGDENVSLGQLSLRCLGKGVEYLRSSSCGY